MNPFDDELSLRLEEKVYASAKGKIRLNLILKDLKDFIPGFSEGGMAIEDIGGGSGRFAQECLSMGHKVHLKDISPSMAALAEKRLAAASSEGTFQITVSDFMKEPAGRAALYCLHGSLEWMENSREALHKIIKEATPGSFLSLLIFNKDKLILKKGINGLLHSERKSGNKDRLTPPGGMSPLEIRTILEQEGTILLQSGIRVFHQFFKNSDSTLLTDKAWMEQEENWYRTAPFNGLGEHSHFILQK